MFPPHKSRRSVRRLRGRVSPAATARSADTPGRPPGSRSLRPSRLPGSPRCCAKTLALHGAITSSTSPLLSVTSSTTWRRSRTSWDAARLAAGVVAGRETHKDGRRLEGGEDPAEHVGQTRRAVAVQEMSNCAEKVADEIAGTGLGGDVELDLIEIDIQPEKVQVKRAEIEVQDLARAGATDDRQAHRQVRHRTEDVVGGIGDCRCEVADDGGNAVLVQNPKIRQRARQRVATGVRTCD